MASRTARLTVNDGEKENKIFDEAEKCIPRHFGGIHLHPGQERKERRGNVLGKTRPHARASVEEICEKTYKHQV